MPSPLTADLRAARRARAARAFPLLALLLAVPLAAAPARALPGGGGIRIDADLVTAAEVWNEYAYINGARSIIHPKPAGGVDEKVFRTAVAQVLQRNLLGREAARRGFALGDAERARLREAQVTAWRGESNYLTALAMLGVGEPLFLRRMELNQLARTMVEADLAGRPAPTAAELSAHYEANLRRYLGTATPLRYVLLPPGTDWEGVRAFARAAHADQADGKTYEEIVRRFSVHASAAAGGIVPEGEGAGGGWPHREAIGNVVAGRISREMRDAAGVHVYVRDQQVPLPLDAVRDKVAADLRAQRIALRMGEIHEQLKQSARIELLEGAAPAPAAAPGAPAGHQGPAH